MLIFYHSVFISGIQNEKSSKEERNRPNTSNSPSEQNRKPLNLEWHGYNTLMGETSTSSGGMNDNYSFECGEKTVRWDQIKPGKFLLVNFRASGSGILYRYVCCIQRKDDDDGEVFVQGLTINNNKPDEFIIKDEKDFVVNFNDIVELLEEPKIIIKNRSIVYKFPKPVNVYEK